MESTVDIEIRRGNNAAAVSWAFEDEGGEPLPVTGRTFILTVRWGGGRIRKDTQANDGFEMDAAKSIATWTPTLLESRAIPLGRLAAYEIELRNGDLQVTIVSGFVTGVGGINDD